MNKRKSKEITESKNYKLADTFEFKSDAKTDRQNIVFFTDLQERIRIGELKANQKGLSKSERLSIIKGALQDHYPEMFANYREILAKKLEEEQKKNRKPKPQQ
jgi:hypothetical protein